MKTKNRTLKILGWIAVPLWASSLSLVVASLMVSHWVSLPHPEQGSQLEAADLFDGQEGQADAESFHTFHFLYGSCPCSRRVLSHVVARNPIENANERIVLIGADKQQQQTAETNGYEVDVVTPQTLKSKYGIESAPLLVITNSQGTILYSGGYTSRKQGLDYQDAGIIATTIRGDGVDNLPLYGCAVSKSLKSIVDPLNLKY